MSESGTKPHYATTTHDHSGNWRGRGLRHSRFREGARRVRRGRALDLAHKLRSRPRLDGPVPQALRLLSWCMNRSSKHFNAGSSLATNRMAGCLLSAAKAEPRCASIGYKPPAPEVFVPTFVALARLLSNLVRHDRPGRCRWHSPVFLWCVDKNSKSLRFQRVSDHWALVRIDVGRSRVRLPLVGALSYGLLHPWTCRSSHRRSSWWCLLPSSCWSPRWCLLPSASGLTEEIFPRTAIELIELLAVQLIISTRQSPIRY